MSLTSLTKVLIRKSGSFFIDFGEKLHTIALGKKPDQYIPSKTKKSKPLALVAGYFSFKDGFATFGDTTAKNVLQNWLEKAGLDYDVAIHPSNGEVGVNLSEIDPQNYDVFIFVCGPWRMANVNLLRKFNHCLKIGVNLSIEDTNSNLFDLLYPRDFNGSHYPDIVFQSKNNRDPIVGVCLVHPQSEYGSRQRHQQVHNAVLQYLNDENVSYIILDTLYLNNPSGIRDTKSFENIISRLDVVISSRLHGTVFSLKNGTPVVAIDAISGGAKLTKQVNSIGWDIILNGDDITPLKIKQSVQRCLTDEIKQKAAKVKQMACNTLDSIEDKFISDIKSRLPLE
jgi:hypothetical protein